MKKLIRIALALCMVACLVCTAFANSNVYGVDLGGAEGPNGSVTVTQSAPTVTPTTTQVVEVLKDVAPAGTKAEDLSVVYAMDLSVPAEDLPVTITFTVNGAKANDDVYVLHYNGSTWDVVASGKGGTIAATFKSLSPVAVVLQAAATTPANPSGPSGDKPSSPQTGADMTLMYVGVAVFLAAGAVAFVTKKKSA